MNAFCKEVVAIYCKSVLFYLRENNFHASLKVSKAKLICRFVKIMYYYAFFLLNNLGAQRHKSRSPVLNSYYCF